MNARLVYFFGFFLGLWLSAAGQEIWTPCANVPVQTALLCITYAKGMFVAGGVNGTIITSTDGVLWTERISGTKNGINSITYGNDLFMAVGDRGTILVSGDGGAWIDRSLPDSVKNQINIPAVTYGAGRFVMSAYWPVTSIDNGITWAPLLPIMTTSTIFTACYRDGQFIVAGARNTIMMSTVGDTWNVLKTTDYRIPSSQTSTNRAIAFSDAIIVLLSHSEYSPASTGLKTSPDGVTWQYQPVLSGVLRAVTHGNGYFVAVGDSGRIYSSPDGIAWAQNESGTKAPLSGVAVGNNTFVAVGSSGTIIHSPALLPVRWSSGGVRHHPDNILVSGRTCRYTLGSAGRAVAKIYTLKGNVAATLVDEVLSVGTYSLSIPPALPAGSYILAIGSGNKVISSRVNLLRQ